MSIAQTLSETWFDDEAQHHRTQVSKMNDLNSLKFKIAIRN